MGSITESMARVVVMNTVQRGLQSIVRQAVINAVGGVFDARSHVIAAALVVAGAEAMVTTEVVSKENYLAICAAAYDHAVM